MAFLSAFLVASILLAAVLKPKMKGPTLLRRKDQEPLTQSSSGLSVTTPPPWLRLPFHKAQLLSYMKLLDVPLDLLINFP